MADVLVALVATASVGAAVGCGDATPGSGTTAVADGTYLAADNSSFAAVPGTRVRLVIDGATLGASAGCNNLGGSWRIDDGRLVVADLAGTMMGCEPELQRQDERLSALLTSRPAVAASVDGFTLTADDGTTLVFVDRRVADPDVPVEATLWRLTTVITADTASTAIGFDSVSMRLDAGTLTVTSACATGTTTYVRQADDTYDVERLVLTATADVGDGDCTDGVIEAQQAVVAVLDGAVVATVEASALTLRGSDLGLGFTAV